MSLDKPRFRRDLEARQVLVDGQAYIEVRDVAAGTAFLLYDFEYQVALAFDGLPLEKVIPWVKLATGLALQADQLREFASHLDELGFLERETPAPATSEAPTAPAGESAPTSTEASAEVAAPEPDAPVAVQVSAEVASVVGEEKTDASAESPATPTANAPPAPMTAPPTEEPRMVPSPSIDAAPVTAASEIVESPSASPEPRETTPGLGEHIGPPDPDTVVMHPSEVVGETPPPVSIVEVSTDKSFAVAEAADKVEPAAEFPAVPPETAAEKAGASDDETDDGCIGDEGEAIADAIMRKAGPPTEAATEPEDGPVFPVLPLNRPTPDAAPAAPPPWTTPRPLVTPRPATLGPTLIETASARRRTRRSLVVFGTLGVLAAAAVLALALPFLFSARRPTPVDVRTLTVAPGTVYRYFEGSAPIAEMPGPTLKFPAGGKVGRIVAKGSAVAVGDVVAAVDAAKGLQNQLVRQRERIAYYQQMAEAMHQVGNAKEEERQLAKVEARNAAIAKTLHELASLAVVATAAGEVEEVLAREGQSVDADGPAVRLRSPGFRASFDLPRTQAAQARRLGFCQVEVEGYLLDCTPASSNADDAHVSVDLAAVPAALVGKLAHLARARYSSATVLPVVALQVSGPRVTVFVVSPNARLEARPVVVADRDEVEAIVVQGLDVGDKVVVDPALGLRAGMSVAAGR
jgi:hypothetical protein